MSARCPHCGHPAKYVKVVIPACACGPVQFTYHCGIHAPERMACQSCHAVVQLTDSVPLSGVRF